MALCALSHIEEFNSACCVFQQVAAPHAR